MWTDRRSNPRPAFASQTPCRYTVTQHRCIGLTQLAQDTRRPRTEPMHRLWCCCTGAERSAHDETDATPNCFTLSAMDTAAVMISLTFYLVVVSNRVVRVILVSGCPNPTVPANAWFRRTADGRGGVMGCQHSADKTSFHCVDNVWRGPPLVNCSEREHSLHPTRKKLPSIEVGLTALA